MLALGETSQKKQQMVIQLCPKNLEMKTFGGTFVYIIVMLFFTIAQVFHSLKIFYSDIWIFGSKPTLCLAKIIKRLMDI